MICRVTIRIPKRAKDYEEGSEKTVRIENTDYDSNVMTDAAVRVLYAMLTEQTDNNTCDIAVSA